jgi:hypothetical protein
MTMMETRRQRLPRTLAFGAAFAALLLAASAGQTLGHAEHGHPARIHEGTCEDLGRVAFRLNGVGGSVDLDNAPVELPAEVNPDAAYQVMISDTMIDGSLDDLLATDHAVMVYESDDNMRAISCGNLGGAMTGDTLITGLAESGIPGHLGFAVFTQNGQQTDVSLILGHAMAPVSASGNANHDHADDEDAHTDDEDAAHVEDDAHAEEDAHEPAATPHP